MSKFVKSCSVVEKRTLKEAQRLVKEATLSKKKKTKELNCCFPQKDYASMIVRMRYESDLIILFRHLRLSLLKHDWDSAVEYLRILRKNINRLSKSSSYHRFQSLFFKNALHIVLLNHPCSNSKLVDTFLMLNSEITDDQINSILDDFVLNGEAVLGED